MSKDLKRSERLQLLEEEQDRIGERATATEMDLFRVAKEVFDLEKRIAALEAARHEQNEAFGKHRAEMNDRLIRITRWIGNLEDRTAACEPRDCEGEKCCPELDKQESDPAAVDRDTIQGGGKDTMSDICDICNRDTIQQQLAHLASQAAEFERRAEANTAKPAKDEPQAREPIAAVGRTLRQVFAEQAPMAMSELATTVSKQAVRIAKADAQIEQLEKQITAMTQEHRLEVSQLEAWQTRTNEAKRDLEDSLQVLEREAEELRATLRSRKARIEHLEGRVEELEAILGLSNQAAPTSREKPTHLQMPRKPKMD